MLLRLIVFGIIFIFFNKQQINAVRELYGQSSGRIKPSSNNLNLFKIQNDFSKDSKFSRIRGNSPTFIQSRHYHSDQMMRDNHDLGLPSSYQSQLFSSASYPYGGSGTNLVVSSQEGCRLTNNYCSHDYQCCSGKCRCVRWSVMGKMSCYKKCF